MDSRAQTEQFLSGGGEMGALIRSMDWSATPLGPTSSWPQSLRTSVSLCLSSTFPILIAWGPETIQIYNDSYRPICGAKHPEAMGQNFRICWATALPVVGDAFTRGEHGEGTYIKDQRMFLDRYGYLEESFMTFSFAPIRDESGEVGGIFHPITETTEKMLSARRTRILRDIAAATAHAREINELATALYQQYEEYQFDLPFFLVYIIDRENGGLSLKLVTGLSPESVVAAPFLEKGDLSHTPWNVPKDLTDRFVVTGLSSKVDQVNSGPYPESPHTACIYPIRIPGQGDVYGYIIAGVSSRRALDQEYLSFYDQLSAIVNTACSSIDASFQEARKIEAMAAIDQAKTAFFNNVSHEFRTPLTLMMGPLEELLASGQITEPAQLDPLQTVQRNAFRLLKLVNNLLDFSRQEAGRVTAQFQPVDIAGLTQDIASSFRSVMEKAGLLLTVHCDDQLPPVYVDPLMWEKILLNLLSNAFKFTMEGSVAIVLKREQGFVVLTVTDTGAGIPEEDIPRSFSVFTGFRAP